MDAIPCCTAPPGLVPAQGMRRVVEALLQAGVQAGANCYALGVSIGWGPGVDDESGGGSESGSDEGSSNGNGGAGSAYSCSHRRAWWCPLPLLCCQAPMRRTCAGVALERLQLLLVLHSTEPFPSV